MSLTIWKNTATLDHLISEFQLTTDKQLADIALLGSKPIDLNEFPKLSGLFRAGVGRDNVPIEEAKSRNISICFPSQTTVDVIHNETANFTCHLILKMMYANIGTLSPWKKEPREALDSRRLLIIGNGSIGNRVANKMKDLMKVDTYDILENTDDELVQKISEADCISLHIPLTPDTTDFIDDKKLNLMKPGAVIINTARGPIVNELDLYHHIKNDRIRAAFDVFWQEPYTGKLTELNNEKFYMSPHVASTCSGFLQGCKNDLVTFMESLKHV